MRNYNLEFQIHKTTITDKPRTVPEWDPDFGLGPTQAGVGQPAVLAASWPSPVGDGPGVFFRKDP